MNSTAELLHRNSCKKLWKVSSVSAVFSHETSTSGKSSTTDHVTQKNLV